MKFILILTVLITGNQLFAQCNGSEPQINLGNDTVLCTGETLNLLVQPIYDFYSWSTGSSNNSITVNSSGVYSVNASIIGANVILNGDFEGGNTAALNNFSTAYIPGTGGSWGILSNPGTYAISTSPNNVHTNFSNCPDHTTGTGNMLIANGSSTAGTSVWCQTVNVFPNIDYIFSCWAMNVISDPNISNLQFFVNGVQIGGIFSTTPIGCEWLEFNDVWNSGANTTAQLCIVNQNITGGGNDFALDDIYFAPVCLISDTIVVSYDNTIIDAGPDLVFCENIPENCVATSNGSVSNYLWNDGTQGNILAPISSGTYSVTGTSANGCVISDFVDITVKQVDWAIDQIFTGPTDCGASTGYVSVATNGVFEPGFPAIYTWSGPGSGSSNFINASVWDNLSSGWYYIDIVSNGCHEVDSAQVVPLNSPIAGIIATPLFGYTPLTVDFSNTSQNATSYLWDFGNGITLPIGNQNSQSQIYTTGVYEIMLVAYNGNCSDTAYTTINVLDPPIILPVSLITSNVFTPNSDGSNDVFTFQLENIVQLEISILNRWGAVVFTSTDINFSWNGKVNGNLALEGVYFYTYKAVGAQNEQFEGQGFLHLEY